MAALEYKDFHIENNLHKYFEENMRKFEYQQSIVVLYSFVKLKIANKLFEL